MKAYSVTLKNIPTSFLIHGWSDKENGFVHGCYPNGERSGLHIVDVKDFEAEKVDEVHNENYSWKP
jgi:hypothetical protein